MTVQEPTFIQAELEEMKHQPHPIFTFYGAPKSETDEVSLEKPEKRAIFDEVLQTTTLNLFALVESWRYPILYSTGTDIQKFVDDQMRKGFPLFALRDPKNESICWQLNIRYFDSGHIEFDALAFRGEPGKAVIVLWLTHVGHLESIQLTNDTVRATLYSYFDDSFVEYSLRYVANKILSTFPVLNSTITKTGNLNNDMPSKVGVMILGHTKDLIDLGLPEHVEVLNERLNIGAGSLFSMILLNDTLTIVPNSFPSGDGFINESGLIDGTRWVFHFKQNSGDSIGIYAWVWEERHNQKKLLMDWEQVGLVHAFNVADSGDKSQVKIASHYRNPVICGFIIDIAGDILNRVYSWEWGRADVWRKEKRAKIFSDPARPAPTEPTTMSGQHAKPNIERKYRTTRDAFERVVRDFTGKWSGDSTQRAPFADARVEWIGQAQIEIEGKLESPKGLENAFEYLPMVKLTPTIINADWLKVEAWAMNWTENPDAKKTVDIFLASLIRELDHYLGDAPNVTTPTMQAQSPAPTDAPKTTKWTTDRIAFETYKATVKMLRANYVLLILTILVLVVAVLTFLFSQGIFQNFTYAATPTLTPTLVAPTATP